ncbi:hypothetical protein [Chamaesiphon sp. OTE_75_metabat_556]|uniref:hypothetical protein n=1 Tax=Chamaesiphon sp. OTE_75_metabat_556 TaxID=2964692 RepID=UPI00286AADDB|nr:hypothetical protein [Chamaesiphon sp. OTE_75_metabat_556]
MHILKVIRSGAKVDYPDWLIIFIHQPDISIVFITEMSAEHLREIIGLDWLKQTADRIIHPIHQGRSILLLQRLHQQIKPYQKDHKITIESSVGLIEYLSLFPIKMKRRSHIESKIMI